MRRWWRWPGPTPAATRAPVVHDVHQAHDEVAHYWTDERMEAARAREQKLPQPDEDR
jgi:hypothetical protein